MALSYTHDPLQRIVRLIGEGHVTFEERHAVLGEMFSDESCRQILVS